MRKVLAVVLAASLSGGTMAASQGTARAAPGAAAKPDYKKAGELYKAGEAAMKAEKFAEAAAAYQGAYDITADPVLFFKIASAYERASNCEAAVPLFERYLAEGKPNAEFTALTTTRVQSCRRILDAKAKAEALAAAEKARADQAAAEKAAADKAAADQAALEQAAADKAAADKAAAEQTEGPAITGPAPEGGSHRTTVAWVGVGLAVGFATVGVVMAMSAKAAEDDIDDLLSQQVGGQPTEFSAAAMERYDDLVDSGNRYEKLSWVSFGLAGGAAIAATVLFLLPKPARKGETFQSRLHIAPQVSADGGGFVGAISF